MKGKMWHNIITIADSENILSEVKVLTEVTLWVNKIEGLHQRDSIDGIGVKALALNAAHFGSILSIAYGPHE